MRKLLALFPIAFLAGLAACGGGGGSGGSGGGGSTPPPTNSAPQFTISADITSDENETVSVTITVSDANGDAITVSLSGGADAALFSLDTSSLVLTSNTSFDFEAPRDANADNVYEVTLTASDGQTTVSRTFMITITNVIEGFADLRAVAFLGNQVNMDTGQVVAVLPDIDGDNRDEILFAAGRSDVSTVDYEGAVYLVSGAALAEFTEPYYDLADGVPPGVLRFDGSGPEDIVGLGVESLGDLDGDGLAELTIGLNKLDDESVFILKGSALRTALSGGTQTFRLRETSGTGMAIEIEANPDEHGGVGTLTRPVGDFDGDGKPELLVCAPWSDSGDPGFKTAKGYVLFGDAISAALVSNSNIQLDQVVSDGDGVLLRQETGQNFSCESGSAAGDFYADGVDDLLYPDPSYDSPYGRGATHIVFGQAIVAARASGDPILLGDLAPNGQGMTFFPERTDAGTGGNAYGVGDVNGDTYDDILITGGGNTYPDDIYLGGVSYVLYGGPDFSALTASGTSPELDDSNTQGLFVFTQAIDLNRGVQLNGAREYDNVDMERLPGGDMDGDGKMDIIISSGFANGDDLTNSGEVYVVYGAALSTPALLSLGEVGDEVAGLRFVGMDAFDIAGSDSAFGDFDGDGKQDLVIGALGADPNGVSRGGEIYILSGAGIADNANSDGEIGLKTFFPELDDPD
tara:strand:+ start:3637 stop:5703 length:2067 start_codon:yes stop_codon:yes gene_type:complete